MTFAVKVIPGSPRTELAGEMADGTWKVKLAARPEKGEANDELCRFLARHFGVEMNAVSILSGQTSRRKLVRIETKPAGR